MRKAVIVLTSGLGIGLLCSVGLANEEPGSRMTFGQRMNSVFGLVDTASQTPPPPPPPNATNYQKRPQHTTVPTTAPTTGRPANSAIPHNAAPAQKPAYTSNAAVPPTPRRDDGVAQVAAPAEASYGGQQLAKPSILMQSRAANAQQNGAVRAAPAVNNAMRAAPNAGSIAPVPTAAGAARSGTAPVMQAPVSASRRRPLDQRSTTEPLTEANTNMSVAPAMEVPIGVPTRSVAPAAAPIVAATKPTAGGDEPFIPSIPMMADRRASGGVDLSPAASAPNEPATLPVDTSTSGSRPLAAQSSSSNPSGYGSSNNSSSNYGSSNYAAAPALTAPQNDSISTGAAPTTTRAPAGSAVLAAFTSPEVTVETVGPRRISIGREAKFRVIVRNRGQAPAQQVVVSLNVPAWAEVVELNGTSGNTTSGDEQAANKPLQWQLDVLGAKAEEELTLVLIPRKSETFDLGVRWTCSPAAVATSIEVEEPQLQMTIAGPSEVSYGEQRLYKLTVLNPGTGTAENVVLHLQPLTPNDGEAVSHKIGDLKAGQDTSVEVELTARQAGRLKIRTSASADGDLRTEASADVVVHRAQLDINVVAPRVVFAGVPGSYEVRVRNTGDDHARNVKLTVDLPQGTKLITAAPQTKGEAKGNQAAWTIDRLNPGAEQVFSLRCSLESGGIQQITATTSADGDLRKTAQASTDVQSVADIALDVIDTPGPVAVGQSVTYEIHVKNRGMKGAEGVDVVAYFSDGIEPEKAEGQAHELQPGMVIFKSLASVGAGQDRVLRVIARATAAGNHRLRVELHSRAPHTQLSHEDATFFYLDEAPSATETSSNNTPGTFNGAGSTATSGGSMSHSAEHARSLRSGLRGNNSGSPNMTATPTVSAGINANVSTPAPNVAPVQAANPYAANSIGDGAAVANPNRPSDNRYGAVEQQIPTTLPQSNDAVRPATSHGSPNAPGTVYPAALPQRHRANGLR